MSMEAALQRLQQRQTERVGPYPSVAPRVIASTITLHFGEDGISHGFTTIGLQKCHEKPFSIFPQFKEAESVYKQKQSLPVQRLAVLVFISKFP